MSTTGQKTHQAILNAAQDLFGKKGYHSTSIADIAGACNLSKASLYHHIINKEALLCDIIRRAHQQLKDSILAPVLTHAELAPTAPAQLLELLNEPHTKSNVFLLMRLSIDLKEESNYATQALKNYFADWDNTLQQVFSAQTDSTARRSNVDNMMSLVHGAVTFSAIRQNASNLTNAKSLIKNMIGK